MFKSWVSGASGFLQQIMGNHYSSFVRALKAGDAATARDIYHRKKNVRDAIKPNECTGDAEDNTILHHLARLNMMSVYQELLSTGTALPDMKNSLRRNCLHLVCAGSADDDLKHAMLLATLDIGLPCMDIEHILSEKDSVRTHTHTHR